MGSNPIKSSSSGGFDTFIQAKPESTAEDTKKIDSGLRIDVALRPLTNR